MSLPPPCTIRQFDKASMHFTVLHTDSFASTFSLKNYFRNLPNPLYTFEYHQDFCGLPGEPGVLKAWPPLRKV